MSTHVCPVSVCLRDVSDDKLMCAGHWYMVPKPLRRALYTTWRHGDGAGSTEHLAAMTACLSAVERQLEGT